jgi:hypothetical protein
VNMLVLAEQYAFEDDGQLLRLRFFYEELTEEAQTALREELTRRNLWSTDTTTEDHEDGVIAAVNARFVPTSIPVWDAQTPEEAEVVCQLLKLANITAVVHPLSRGLRTVHVHVDPESAERATNLLANGFPRRL